MSRLRVDDYEDYSRRFWSHLDAICAVLCFVAFVVIIFCLQLADGLDPESQMLTNFTIGKDFLVAGAIFTIIFIFLLLLPLILTSTSTYFIQEEDRQLLYILGRNPLEEEEEEELIQVSQPAQPPLYPVLHYQPPSPYSSYPGPALPPDTLHSVTPAFAWPSLD